MKSKGHNRGGKRIIVGATGASGLPILVKCLELIGEQPEYESYLIMSHSAVLTLGPGDGPVCGAGGRAG